MLCFVFHLVQRILCISSKPVEWGIKVSLICKTNLSLNKFLYHWSQHLIFQTKYNPSSERISTAQVVKKKREKNILKNLAHIPWKMSKLLLEVEQLNSCGCTSLSFLYAQALCICSQQNSVKPIYCSMSLFQSWHVSPVIAQVCRLFIKTRFLIHASLKDKLILHWDHTAKTEY